MAAHFSPDDWVLYRKRKYSAHPGPHARDIDPARHGDSYTYYVTKYYRVICVQNNETVVVRTRKGRQRTLAANDPGLRRAHWWERLLFASRFPPTDK